MRYSPFDVLRRDEEAGFDLAAVNAYTDAPRFPDPWFTDGLQRLHDQSGCPVIVSEFGIRARIDGWTNRGGAGASVPTPTAERWIPTDRDPGPPGWRGAAERAQWKP